MNDATILPSPSAQPPNLRRLIRAGQFRDVTDLCNALLTVL